MPDRKAPTYMNLSTLGRLTPPTNPGPGWVGPERPAESWSDVRADPLSALFDLGRGAVTGDAPKGMNVQGLGALLAAALPVAKGAKALRAVTLAGPEVEAQINSLRNSIQLREEMIAAKNQEIDALFGQLPTKGGLTWSEPSGWQGYETQHWERAANQMEPIRKLQADKARYASDRDKFAKQLAKLSKTSK